MFFLFEVFVNKESAAWKRLPQATGLAAVLDTSVAGKTVTVGCSQGLNAMNGRVAHFAVWYWQLADDTVQDWTDPSWRKPGPDSSSDISYLDGGLGPSKAPCLDFDCMEKLNSEAATGQPYLYYLTTLLPISQDDASSEDTSPAIDGGTYS